MKIIFNSSVEDYYKYKKNEYTYFKDWEHVVHNFLSISGVLAAEFNMSSPKYILQKSGKIPGLNPYSNSATEIYYYDSIQVELEKSNVKLFGDLMYLMVLFGILF